MTTVYMIYESFMHGESDEDSNVFDFLSVYTTLEGAKTVIIAYAIRIGDDPPTFVERIRDNGEVEVIFADGTGMFIRPFTLDLPSNSFLASIENATKEQTP